jgi:hypothetical protein
MHRFQLAATGAAVMLAGTLASAQSPVCLHGASETPSDRTRREKAVDLARIINEAQERQRGLRPRGGALPYQPLDRLLNIPAAPAGFVVQHHTDGSTYAVSIKDARDPCRFAVFSDESGDVYEAIPSEPRGGVRLLTRK